MTRARQPKGRRKVLILEDRDGNLMPTVHMKRDSVVRRIARHPGTDWVTVVGYLIPDQPRSKRRR